MQNSLGAVWDELVRGPAQGKWTDARVLNRLIPRVRAIPEALAAGIAALPAEAVAIFASNALASYFPGTGPTSTGPLPLSKQVTAAFAAIVKQPGVSAKTGADLVAAGKEAADWVDRYGIWLAKAVADGGLASNSSVGEANLLWFLEHVSLVNTTLWPLERIVRGSALHPPNPAYPSFSLLRLRLRLRLLLLRRLRLRLRLRLLLLLLALFLLGTQGHHPSFRFLVYSGK